LAIEGPDQKSLSITATRATRIRSKPGPYTDTFMVSVLLAQVQGQTADRKGLNRVFDALGMALFKMHKNELANDAWNDQAGRRP